MPDDFKRPNLKWRFMDAVTRDPKLTDLDRRLAFRLLDYFHVDKGEGWTFHSRLADELSVTREAVSRAMKRLNAKGVFEIASPNGPRGKKVFKPNLGYVTEGSHKAGGNVIGEPVLCDRRTEENVTAGSRHTSKIHFNNTKPLDPEKAFEVFFEVRGYAGKVCKKAARAEFLKLVAEGIPPGDLCDGTMQWAFDKLPKPQNQV